VGGTVVGTLVALCAFVCGNVSLTGANFNGMFFYANAFNQDMCCSLQSCMSAHFQQCTLIVAINQQYQVNTVCFFIAHATILDKYVFSGACNCKHHRLSDLSAHIVCCEHVFHVLLTMCVSRLVIAVAPVELREFAATS